MKLIDVDTFRADHRLAEYCDDCKRNRMKCDDDMYSARVFCSWLYDAPFVDAIPVEWIKARCKNKYSERAVCERWLIEDWQEEQKGKHEQKSTVDAEPVQHGRWIETTIPANTTGHGGMGQDKKKGWLCSNCRCAFDAKLLWCDNYCPNCGSDMRDGGETNVK